MERLITLVKSSGIAVRRSYYSAIRLINTSSYILCCQISLKTTVT